jgi:hypothetical protein
MIGLLEIFLGGIARISKAAARTAVKRAATGAWNKWRGPALRGEAAVYAAKARCGALDGEHAVVT